MMDTNTAARALQWAEGLEHFAEHFCTYRPGGTIPGNLFRRLPGEPENVEAILAATRGDRDNDRNAIGETWQAVQNRAAEADALQALGDTTGQDAVIRLGAHVRTLVGALRRWVAAVEPTEDFRTVRWGTQTFTFTDQQAACVRVLFENKGMGVSQATIAMRVDSTMGRFRLIQAFDKGKHPAWGTMIVQADGKGLYRLAMPDGKKT